MARKALLCLLAADSLAGHWNFTSHNWYECLFSPRSNIARPFSQPLSRLTNSRHAFASKMGPPRQLSGGRDGVHPPPLLLSPSTLDPCRIIIAGLRESFVQCPPFPVELIWKTDSFVPFRMPMESGEFLGVKNYGRKDFRTNFLCGAFG